MKSNIIKARCVYNLFKTTHWRHKEKDRENVHTVFNKQFEFSTNDSTKTVLQHVVSQQNSIFLQSKWEWKQNRKLNFFQFNWKPCVFRENCQNYICIDCGWKRGFVFAYNSFDRIFFDGFDSFRLFLTMRKDMCYLWTVLLAKARWIHWRAFLAETFRTNGSSKNFS